MGKLVTHTTTEISIVKIKVMVSVATTPVQSKIVINDTTIQLMFRFQYVECNVVYNNGNDVETMSTPYVVKRK